MSKLFKLALAGEVLHKCGSVLMVYDNGSVWVSDHSGPDVQVYRTTFACSCREDYISDYGIPIISRPSAEDRMECDGAFLASLIEDGEVKV